MAERPKCFFLDTPRGLRNMIYGYITRSYMISAEPLTTATANLRTHVPDIVLSNTFVLAMLLVSRQFGNEYREHCLPRSDLSVAFNSKLDLTQDLDLNPKFPVKLLKDVRRCFIIIPWHRAMFIDTNRFGRWFLDSMGEQVQANTQSTWTPSKTLYDNIKHNFAILYSKLRAETKVFIEVSIDGQPSPDNAINVGLLRKPTTDDESAPNILASVLHPSTLMALETDNDLVWPKLGNLDVSFVMLTALYCTPEDYINAKHELSQPGSGISEAAFRSMRGEAPAMVRWTLKPTSEENSYYRYFPKCQSTTTKMKFRRASEDDGGTESAGNQELDEHSA